MGHSVGASAPQPERIGLPSGVVAFLPRTLICLTEAPLWSDVLARSGESFGVRVVGCTPAEASLVLAEVDPDGIVVTEIPDHDTMARRLVQRFPELPVGVLHATVGCNCGRRDAGWSDLSEQAHQGWNSLGIAIDALLRGALPVSEGQTPVLPQETGTASVAADVLAFLTPVQQEVLALMAVGLSNAQIAARRGTRVRAVEATVSRIFTRMAPLVEIRGNARVAVTRAYLMARAAAAVGDVSGQAEGAMTGARLTA